MKLQNKTFPSYVTDTKVKDKHENKVWHLFTVKFKSWHSQQDILLFPSHLGLDILFEKKKKKKI